MNNRAKAVSSTKAWKSPPRALILNNNEVHIWLLSLNVTAAQILASWGNLSEEEQKRAQRFQFEEDRDHFLIAHSMLRRILASYLNREAKSLRFSYGDYGKPFLSKEIIRFNLSHSDSFAAYAITQDREIGIDIEYVQPDFATRDIAEQFFSEREVAVFNALPKEVQTQAFFNCWTRKEAFIKAIGEGLSYPLKDFDVTLRPGEPAKLLEIRRPGASASEWGLFDIEVGEEYKAALAVKGPVNQIEYYRFL